MIYRTVRAFLAESWPAMPVFGPNEFITPTPEQPWLYAELHSSEHEQAPVGSPGKRLTRDRALVLIHAFTPMGVGVGPSSELRAELAARFTGAVLPPLPTSHPPPLIQVERVSFSPGPPDGGPWFSEVVSLSLTASFFS